MSENWLPIKNYEGLYEVSNWGRVRSLDHYVKQWQGGVILVKGRILRYIKVSSGYLQVVLYKDGVRNACLVHRLIAQAFISNPDGLPIINHKDENKENNRVENLEWCDEKYNSTYSFGKTVYMYTLDDKLCGLWPSTNECGRHGFNQGVVASCCRGERRTCKGYKWSYEPPVPPKAIEILTKFNKQ